MTRLQSGADMRVCGFTWGDGHVCDQRLGISHAWGPLTPPRGWYYPPAVDGIYELRRKRRARRPTPPDKQPTDEYDQPMWRVTLFGMPTGLDGRHIEGEQPVLPARIRCPTCRQVRTVTP